MKKIYVDKSDNVASVVERILETPEEAIVLYIPRFTKLATPPNFKLLKREIHASGKNVEIESVDDEVLELAKGAGLHASNPFFRKNLRPMSDIVSPHEDRKIERRKSLHAGGAKKVHVKEEEADEDIREEQREEAAEAESADVEEFHHQSHNHHPKPAGKNHLKLGAALAILGIVIAGAIVILPSAKIAVSMEKINGDFKGTLLSSASIKDPYLLNGQIKAGGIVLEKSKNVMNSFPATGSKNVSQKASGKVKIYNAYSSSPQPLVASTRFQSADGKIFRILERITVPGAKIVDNKIVPSSIEVKIYADKPGAEYNVPPGRFTVPGFSGSPKFEGFYAESAEGMSGGFVGLAKVPTDSDILKARDANKKILEDALNLEAALGIPKEIKILEKAGRFVVVKEEVEGIADSAGNFTVTTHGSKKIFGFNESDILEAIRTDLISDIKKAEAAENADLVLKEFQFTYGEPRIDFGLREMAVAIDLKSTWTRSFDKESFEEKILGKKEADIASVLRAFPGVKSVGVRLWPFWVMRIPNNANKVAIDVE